MAGKRRNALQAQIGQARQVALDKMIGVGTQQRIVQIKEDGLDHSLLSSAFRKASMPGRSALHRGQPTIGSSMAMPCFSQYASTLLLRPKPRMPGLMVSRRRMSGLALARRMS